MASQDMQRLIDLVLQLWNTGNADIANQLYTENAERGDPNGSDPARGPQAISKYVAQVRTAFPDFKFEIKQTIVDADDIASHWTCTGTHKGDFLGIPPTGKRVEINGVALAHVQEGKIVREHVYFDRLDMLQQLGVAPAAQTAARAGS